MPAAQDLNGEDSKEEKSAEPRKINGSSLPDTNQSGEGASCSSSPEPRDTQKPQHPAVEGLRRRSSGDFRSGIKKLQLHVDSATDARPDSVMSKDPPVLPRTDSMLSKDTQGTISSRRSSGTGPFSLTLKTRRSSQQGKGFFSNTGSPRSQGVSPKNRSGLSFEAIAMQRIRSNRLTSAARSTIRQIPLWMTNEVLHQTTARARKMPKSQRISFLRAQNSVMQAEMPIWQCLVEAAAENIEVEQAEIKIQTLMAGMRRQLEEREEASGRAEGAKEAAANADFWLLPGPVGDLPLHACILLGMVDLGRQWIEKHYNTAELVSLPYLNDLEVWTTLKTLDPDVDDGGLYTGQTILHIALVRQDIDFVNFLIKRGANITARATGAFFRPRRIKEIVKNPNFWQRTLASLQGLDLSTHPITVINDIPDSGCYYGERPLSFAASIGSAELCQLLWEEAQRRMRMGDPWMRELLEQTQEQEEKKSAQADIGAHGHRVGRQVKGSTPASAEQGAQGGNTPGNNTPANSIGRPDSQLSNKPLPSLKPTRSFVKRDASFGDSGKRTVPDTPSRSSTPGGGPKSGSGGNPQKNFRLSRKKQSFLIHSSMKFSFDFFVNAQDTLGNTAMHLAVLHARTETLNWLLENGGERSLTLLNRDCFTPLTLAARLGHVEQLETILWHISGLAWIYGDVHMIRTPLAQVDSFRMPNNELHQHPQWKSVVDIVVDHEVHEMCDHKLFDKLVMEKWDKFGRRIHLWHSIVPYTLGLILTSVFLYIECFHRRGQIIDFAKYAEHDPVTHFLPFGERMWEGSYEKLGTILAAICFVFIVIPSYRRAWKHRRLKLIDLDPNEDGDTSIHEFMLFVYKNLGFVLTGGMATSLLIGIGAMLIGYIRVELWAVGASAILHWSILLLHVMSFPSIGILVIIVFKMLIGDIFKFLVVYSILVMAFSQALFALTQMSDIPEAMETLDRHPGRAVFKLVWVSLGGRPLGMDNWNMLRNTVNPSLSLVVYLIYVVLCTILMLNLLIAMMQKTYHEDMQDTKKTWIFPFAHMVLKYENDLSASDKVMNRCGRAGSADTAFSSLENIAREPFYEIALEESERSKREKLYGEERDRFEIVLSAMTDYLNQLKDSLGAAVAALSMDVEEWKSRIENKRRSLMMTERSGPEAYDEEEDDSQTPIHILNHGNFGLHNQERIGGAAGVTLKTPLTKRGSANSDNTEDWAQEPVAESRANSVFDELMWSPRGVLRGPLYVDSSDDEMDSSQDEEEDLDETVGETVHEIEGELFNLQRIQAGSGASQEAAPPPMKHAETSPVLTFHHGKDSPPMDPDNRQRLS